MKKRRISGILSGYHFFPVAAQKIPAYKKFKERWIRENVGHMTKGSIERTATIIVVIPGNGMHFAHTCTFFISPLYIRIVAGFIYCHDIIQALIFSSPNSYHSSVHSLLPVNPWRPGKLGSEQLTWPFELPGGYGTSFQPVWYTSPSHTPYPMHCEFLQSPFPDSIKRSITFCWAVSKISPVVFRKMTTWNCDQIFVRKSFGIFI